MKQELMDAITEKTKELMNSVTCSAEARAAAQTWLAVGTQRIEENSGVYERTGGRYCHYSGFDCVGRIQIRESRYLVKRRQFR